jgi:hypothetical protein
MQSQSVEQHVGESRDGVGAGDHDAPYLFGRVPRAATPFPFSMREFARLMILRSRFRSGLLAGDAPPQFC